MKFEKSHVFDGHSSAVYTLAKGRRDDTFFSASADKHVVEWNRRTGNQEAFVVKTEAAVYSIFFEPLSALLFIGTSIGGLHVVSMEQKSELHYFTIHTNGIYGFAFDHKRQHLLIAGGDGLLTVWQLPGSRLLRTIPLSDKKLRQMAVHDDMDVVAVACGDGSVHILDLEMFNEQASWMAHEGGVTSVAWHPGKKILLTGGKDAHIMAWNYADKYARVLSLAAHNYAIYSLVFSPTGDVCVSASRDKTIKVWDARTFDLLQRIDVKTGGHSHSVNSLLFFDDGFISAGDDRRIVAWTVLN